MRWLVSLQVAEYFCVSLVSLHGGCSACRLNRKLVNWLVSLQDEEEVNEVAGQLVCCRRFLCGGWSACIL
jgi:hypothetical protein